MKKYSVAVLALVIFPLFTSSRLWGMEKEETAQSNGAQPFDSRKDYHHFYQNPGFVKSLLAICMGTIANNIKDNVDTKDPLNSKPVIEEIFAQLDELGISPQCLLQYWKVHTQPTYTFRAEFPGSGSIQWYNSDVCILYNRLIKSIGILNDDKTTYFKNPCKKKIKYVSSSPDNRYIAAASDDQFVIILNKQDLR